MSDASVPVIAVDGPSGTGKGTVCQELARTLRWHFLDSGAIYRCLACVALARQVSLADADTLAHLGETLCIRFDLSAATGEAHRVWSDGDDLTQAIRSEQSAHAASVIAVLPQVRAALLQKQRDFQQAPGLVADGRDMGTVVFPAAQLKIFLTATPEERGRRRYEQLKQQGFDANLPRLINDIAERDARDMARSTAPLRPAADAVILDTSNLGREAVFERVVQLAAERGLVA